LFFQCQRFFANVGVFGVLATGKGCWMLVAGYWLLVAGCWLPDAGCLLLVAGCWLLVACCLLLVACCLLLVAGSLGSAACLAKIRQLVNWSIGSLIIGN
jgi:hypothetical protein